jgi:hypothetical protein
MTDTATRWGGWAPAIRDDPFGHFAEARARCPVQRVRLADGHPAWVVLGYEARVAFETLLGRYPGLRLATDRDALAWAHGDGLVLRGLLSLPVILVPVAEAARS